MSCKWERNCKYSVDHDVEQVCLACVGCHDILVRATGIPNKPARHSPPRCVAGAGIAGRAPGRGPLSKHRIPLIGSMLAGAGAAREDQVSSSEGVATGATPQVGTGSTMEAAGATGVSGGSVATGGMRMLAGTASKTATACAPGDVGVPAGGTRPTGMRSAVVATGSDGVEPSSMQQLLNSSQTTAAGAQKSGTGRMQQAGTSSAVAATGSDGDSPNGVQQAETQRKTVAGGVQQAGLCSAAAATGALGGGGEVQAGEADELMDTETTMNMAPVPRTSTVLPAIPAFDSSNNYNSMVWASAVVKPGVQAVKDAVGGKADAAPAGHPRADETALTQQFPGAPGLQFTQSA